ncbi:hypothetical protein Poli38472_006379 [Pythium oligandrum]|uniref:Uncharacterized protein n=1 Tax=Pythium oligandrum TaxID=41045 RepID=A0A8K1FD02_PYTOL|nr:hypothetical protein Poli38472_006379 [Pythium oligandrum]|eukprot:TMW56369.1 hypothetical protein Poli38472_006379 [Pythium oligandrum]
MSADSISKDKFIAYVKAAMKVLEAEQDHFELELKSFNAVLEVLMSLSNAGESYALGDANEVCNACSLDESERLRASQQASEELISGHFNICGPRLHNLRRLYSDCHSAYQRKANEGIDIEMRAQLLEDEVLDDNISCNTREARVQKYRSMPKESTKRLRHIAETLGTLWVRMNAVLPREMLVPLRRPFRGLPADHQLVSQSHGKAADSPPSEYHPMKLEVVGPFFVQPSTAVIDLTDDGESGDSLTISENSGSPLSRLEGEPVREQRVIFLPEDSQVHRVGDILYTKECTEDDEPHFFQCHVKDVLLNNAFRVVYDDDKEDVVESKFLFTDDQMKADLEDQDMENLCQCVVM